MLKTALLKQIGAAVLGLSLASSGLAYAGVDEAPNPVDAAVQAVSSEGEDVEARDDGPTSTAETPDEAPTSTAETADEAEEGKATADAKRQAAQDYTDAVRDWTDCVQENASAQGDEETRVEGEFDPREGCDERPDPHDFGLSEVPEQASDEGKTHSEQGRERGEEARSNRGKPSDVPADDEGTEGSEKPEASSEGRPEDTPDSDDNPGNDAEENGDSQDGRPDHAGPPEDRPGR